MELENSIIAKGGGSHGAGSISDAEGADVLCAEALLAVVLTAAIPLPA